MRYFIQLILKSAKIINSYFLKFLVKFFVLNKDKIKFDILRKIKKGTITIIKLY